MQIELLAQNKMEGTIYDLSRLASDIVWDTEITGQPGKLTFSYVDAGVNLPEGSTVRLNVNGQGVFFGYIFTHTRNAEGIVGVTAYDQLKYFKNKNTYVISEMTASQVFTKLCADAKLKQYKVVNPSSYIVSARVHDDKSLYEVVERALDETLAYAGEWYIIRDNFGTLEFLDLKSLKKNIIIGDQSLLNDFEFESSIDGETYNQIKLVQENKTSKKREVYIAKDSNNIAAWGLLQYYEKVDETINPAQIKEKADKLLNLKNRVTKELSLTSLGHLDVFAGVQIVVDVEQLKKEGIEKKYFLVTKCSHTFANQLHTMELELKVI